MDDADEESAFEAGSVESDNESLICEVDGDDNDPSIVNMTSPSMLTVGGGSSNAEVQSATATTSKKRGQKPVNAFIRDQFSSKLDEATQKNIFTCNHCQTVKRWQTWNASYATKHIIHHCRSACREIKMQAGALTQSSKRLRESGISIPGLSGGSVAQASRAATSVSVPVTVTTFSSKNKDQQHRPTVNLKMTDFGKTVNNETAYDTIRMSVETVLARFEPISHIQDPFFRRELHQRWSDPILKHIPGHTNTVFECYVMPINEDTTRQIAMILRKTAGGGTLAVDSVTISGTSYLMYTYSKGSSSIFLKMTTLRDQVHVTDAEVNDALQRMEDCVLQFNGVITALAVDNGARATMAKVIKRYKELHPNAPPLLTQRDCAHCIDLLAKDSASVSCFDLLMVDVNKLIDLLSVDRVNGIRSELIRTGKLANSVIKVDKLSETRFNKMGITLTSIKLQRPFLEMLSSGFEEFQDYYLSRPADRRNKIDAALNIPSHKFWQKVDVAIDWFEKINYATKLVSSEKFPMSAYFPLVRALRNEFDEILQDRGTDGVCKFDSVFGAGCCTELADFIKSRFNMDGDGTSTRKVGLLDRYQIWAYLVDPYKDKLPKQLAIEPSVVEQVNSMLDFFVRSDDQDFQLDVRRKYMEYYSRHGEWLHAFSHLPVRDRMTDEEIPVDQQKLTLAEVSKWATDTGGHDT